MAQDPISAPPRAISPSPSNVWARLVSSAPQPCPAQLWTPPSWARVPSWPHLGLSLSPGKFPLPGAALVPLNCPGPGWEWDWGLSPGYQALPLQMLVRDIPCYQYPRALERAGKKCHWSGLIQRGWVSLKDMKNILQSRKKLIKTSGDKIKSYYFVKN